MATVNTNDLRISNAKNFASSLGQGSYVFVGRQQPWESDVAPPTPINNYEEFISTYNQMVSMNRIASTDVFHMIPRLNWTSGAVYDIYRHDYSNANRSFSGASNLLNASWITINASNSVYACLGNNKNTASTVEPQNTGNEPFYTSDGYQWLFLYTLTADQLFAYGTNNFLPIIDTNSVTTTAGEIYSAVIDVAGNNYTGSPAGVNNQLPYYYCNVTGDGTGAVARISVSLGSITDITIVRQGSGYTWATVGFEAGKVYQSLGDLDSAINALDPLGDGTFRSTVILTPPGGFGSDLVRELGGIHVGIFSSLNYDLYDFVEDMTFRQVGIIQNPTLEGNPVTASACYAVKVNTYGGVANFTIGETITQDQTALHSGNVGEDHTAKGTIVGWDATNGIIRYIQDPEYHTNGEGNLYRFTGEYNIVGGTSSKVGVPDTEFTGELTDITFTGGYAQPEVTKYTGTMPYLTNISPVLRQPAQTEKIRLIIAY
jgi:hypothetical protein